MRRVQFLKKTFLLFVLSSFLASTTAAGAKNFDGQRASCLAPPSEGKKDNFQTVRRAMDSALQEQIPDPSGDGLSSLDRTVKIFGRLIASFGVYWPLLAAGSLINISPLYAAGQTGLPVRHMSGIEVAGIVLSAAVVISLVTYFVARFYRGKEENTTNVSSYTTPVRPKTALPSTTTRKPPAVPVRPGERKITPPATKQISSLEEDMNRLLGDFYIKPLIDPNTEANVWNSIKQARPIAIFDQKIDQNKMIRYELRRQYLDGSDPVSNQALKRRNQTMNYTLGMMKKIEEWIAKERNADMVLQVVIVDDDEADLHVRKGIGVMVIPFERLRMEAKLKISVVHEIDHLAIKGYGPLEEILTWSHAAVRMFNDWNDPANKDWRAKLVKEMPLYDIKYGGTYRDQWIVGQLQIYVQKEERRLNRKLSNEEILWLAVPLTWETMREDFEQYVFIDMQEDVNKQRREIEALKMKNGQEILVEVKKLFEANKKGLLRGQPLRGIILPLGLIDFCSFIPDSPIMRIAVQVACLGSILYEGALIRKVAEYARDTHRALSEALSPSPMQPLYPVPFAADFMASTQNVETSS